MASHIEDGGLFLDVLQLVELALAAAGTDLAGLGPRFGVAEVGIPEGPSPTLPRPLLVDFAFTGLVVEKHAVAVLVLD